eukprot:6203379-Pleurochrysis_carterae.AAC.1
MTTPTPVSSPRTGLQMKVLAGGAPGKAAGSALPADGQCNRRLSTSQRRTLLSRSARSCSNADTTQRRSRAHAAPPPLAFLYNSALSRAAESRRPACEPGSSRLQGPRTTQLTKEVRSPQTSPPRIEPSIHGTRLFLISRVLSSHSFDFCLE